MYSPYSDLHKMLHTPEFILFKVNIAGREYFGRPDTIRVKHAYDLEPQSGIFTAYSSQQAFEAGYPGEKLPVDSTIIKGIKAIDIVNPTPLNLILAACNEINQITTIPVADVGRLP